MKVMVPQCIEDTFAGITASGDLVIDTGTGLVALTPCCQAVVTFVDYSLCCKGCYREVSLEYADDPHIHTPRAQLTVEIEP
ncbi:hypothetical protein [Nocardia altamirensis]|uniref:hypothetical protein n=1 Tax=Nocardia altamirensis TaxID=472158 RepID=UPI00084076BE|nr:hypothetical protein [Nocardia altamirensis]